MLAYIIAILSVRHRRSRAHNTDWPYFVASRSVDAALPEGTASSELPETDAEKEERRRVREAKTRYVKNMIENNVQETLAEMGVTSRLGGNLDMIVRLDAIVTGMISTAEAEIRKRRLVRD